MNSATQNPLSDDELLELAEFLVSEAVPETAMDIETLDGFLCALAVGPESVTLGEALPNVWSDDPGVGAAPVWASPDQHGRITGLIGRMYAELAEAVSAEEQIEPLIVEPDGDRTTRRRVAQNCEGKPPPDDDQSSPRAPSSMNLSILGVKNPGIAFRVARELQRAH